MSTVTTPAPNPEMRLRLMRRKILEWLRQPPQDKAEKPLLAKELPSECSVLCDTQGPMFAMVLKRSTQVFVYVMQRNPLCAVTVNELQTLPEHGIERWLAKTAMSIERSGRVSDVFLPKRFIRSITDQQQVAVLRKGNIYCAYGIEQPVFKFSLHEV